MDKGLAKLKKYKQQKNLSQAKDGTWVRVTSIPSSEAGGRLEAMGLRPQKVLQKISKMPLGGPVTVSCDRRHFAIGENIAKNIEVEDIAEDSEEKI